MPTPQDPRDFTEVVGLRSYDPRDFTEVVVLAAGRRQT
jgi:hypothetical protein